MPLYALAFLLGACVAFYGNRLPDPLWFAFIPLLGVLAFTNSRYRLIWIFLAGYLLCGLCFYQSLNQRLPPVLHDEFVVLRGQIDSLVQHKPGRISFLFKPDETRVQKTRLPPLIRLSWYQQELVPLPGSFWQFEVKLRPPRGRLNPRGFDYEQWLFVEGIGATGYVRSGTHNQQLVAPEAFHLDYLRHNLLQKLDAACAECVTRGLIKALVTGFRGDINPAHRELLANTGTAHLLAISGLHVGMVAFLFYWLGFALWQLVGSDISTTRRQFSHTVAMGSAVVFSAMAGFSLPTQRALIFVLILFLASLLRQRVNFTHCVSLSVILVIALDPLAVGSASFWLTLSALLVIGATMFQLQTVSNRWLKGLVMQLNFSILLALPSLFFLGYFSLVGLPANLIAVPVVTMLVLPGILFAALLLIMGASDLAESLLVMTDAVTRYLMKYLETLESFSWAKQDPVNLNTAVIMLMMLLFIAWWAPFPNSLRRLSPLFLWLMLQYQPEGLSTGDYQVTVLDSGLGNAIVVKTQNHSLLYDFGPGYRGGYSTLDQVILPFLGQAGMSRLDMAIVSHVDSDHSGGFHAMRRYKSDAILLSGTPRLVQDRFKLAETPRNCHSHGEWDWDGVHFQFLDDNGIANTTTNNRSCVLVISGHHKSMIPGDIERKREQRLVAHYGADLKVDFLVSPHHGSRTSSSIGFLSKVSPSVVVHTQSQGNRWGFPHSDVVQRYKDLDVLQLLSGDHGAVEFESRKDGFAIAYSRHPGQRIWR